MVKNKKNKKEEKKLDITGSWYLNRNTAVDPIVEDKMYGTLRNLFGDSLGNGDGALKLNNDGSFSIELGFLIIQLVSITLKIILLVFMI